MNARNTPPRTVPNKDKRSKEWLSSLEIDRLIAGANHGPLAMRNKLMLTIGYRHALRASELLALDWDQVDFPARTIYIVRSKNGINSIHSLEEDEIRGLKRIWRKQGSPSKGLIFLSKDGKRLSPRTFRHIVQTSGKRAKLGDYIHPHMLRHSKGYNLVNRDVNLRKIQVFMGHKCIQNTLIYTQLKSDRFVGLGRHA